MYKTCELCDKEFTCNPDTTGWHVCWCHKEPRGKINYEYKDCICRDCLRETHDKEIRRTV